MRRKNENKLVQVVVVTVMAVCTIGSMAFKEKEGQSQLDLLQFASPRLSVSENSAPIEDFRSLSGTAAFPGGVVRFAGWDGFLQENGPKWIARLDRRTGLPAFCMGSGKPWVPGAGNALEAPNEPSTATLEAIARDFLAQNANLLPVDQSQLALSASSSGEYGGYLWYVHFNQYHDGLLVEGAQVFFRVNHGNLVQFGTANFAPVMLDVEPKFTLETAWEILAGYLGGFQPGDETVEAGRLSVLPVAPLGSEGFHNGPIGAGLAHALVYTLIFRRPGVLGTWQAKIDAHSGEILSFQDQDLYGTVTGGIYPLANSDTEVARPFAGMEVTNGDAVQVTDRAGHYNYLGGEGRADFVDGSGWASIIVTDECDDDGTPFYVASSAAPGNLSFGTGPSGQTNCAAPPSTNGPGDTHAARTTFYHVDKLKQQARAWLPTNSWLSSTLPVIVNATEGGQRCNAKWRPDLGALQFFESGATTGGTCSNTGEMASIIAHEFGHGLDWWDGNQPSDNNPISGKYKEAYADVMSFIYTHDSCLGRNFIPGVQCNGWGVPCTDCPGLREANWRKRDDPFDPDDPKPHTPLNYTKEYCFGNTPMDQRACGRGEGYCATSPMVEAVWDLATYDLPGMGIDAATAWNITERLWFLSRKNSIKAYQCTISDEDTSFATDGCNGDSWVRNFQLADDDNGNLFDGTPHGAAIREAFHRHAMACDNPCSHPDPGPGNCSRGCTSPPSQPTLTAVASSRKVQLSWNAVSNASKYIVLRNETSPDSAYIPYATGLTGTSFVDYEVANGFTYRYRVQGVTYLNGEPTCWGLVSAAQTVTPSGSLYTISGLITDRDTGAAMENTFVDARDAASHYWASGRANASGAYTLYELAGGTYTVRPVKRCYGFSPPTSA